jgi:hypothetical protein
VSKISTDLEKLLIAKAGEGYTIRELRAWLLSEHGVSVATSAVAKRLVKMRDERAEVTKAVIVEQVSKHVTADLDVMTRELTRMSRVSRRLYQEATANGAVVLAPSWEMYLRTQDRLSKYVEMRLKYAGAEGSKASADSVQLPADSASRAAVLRALAEREEEKE